MHRYYSKPNKNIVKCLDFMGTTVLFAIVWFQKTPPKVFKVTQRDHIVEHNMSDSPEQCPGEQTYCCEQCPVFQDIMSWTICSTARDIVVDNTVLRRGECYGGTYCHNLEQSNFSSVVI